MRREEKLPGASAAAASPVSATTGPATTGPAATGPATTGPATTGPATTGPATTGPAAMAPVGHVPQAALEPVPPVAEPAHGVAEPAAREPQKQATAPDRIPWLIALAAFAAYLPISVFRYLRFDPTSWDLGIFTEYVKQYADLHAPVVDVRGAGVNLLGDHFHPIVAVIAPFFRAFPSPVTLLVAQALLAAVSVVPVSRAAAERLGTGAGRAIGAAYGFSWGLQQLVNFDFHEIAFAVPLLACSLSALVRGRMRAAVWWAMPLVFVKEDQGFTVAGIGLIMAIVYREQITGLFLAAWGLVWSFLAVSVIIPHLNHAHRYLYWSDGGAISPVGGHLSVGGLLSQLVAGSSTKLPTLAMILLPTAFIALRSPLVLAALPSLALRFVGTNSSYWGTYWHYNATVMPIVFIAAIDAIARVRAARVAREGWAAGQGRTGRPGWDAREPEGRGAALTEERGARDERRGKAVTHRRPGGEPREHSEPGRLGAAVELHGAAVMLAIAAALVFQFPLSSLWNPQTYPIGPQVAAARAAMAQVPDGAQVATDLDLLAPLAVRTDTYWLGNSATNPATTYVVFDTASTDWQPPPRNVLTFIEGLNRGVRYRQIYVNDGVYVFIRADQAPSG
ncbi:MAG TPA: DUF2079 domain-containing protein [Streptosporangiaceae bacterium]|nr:DUF2079 domain-containing protein [Streptosporangiaceae bacterium]